MYNVLLFSQAIHVIYTCEIGTFTRSSFLHADIEINFFNHKHNIACSFKSYKQISVFNCYIKFKKIFIWFCFTTNIITEWCHKWKAQSV